MSVVVHVIAAVIAWRAVPSTQIAAPETVDIEVAPPPPPPEALPAEVARSLDRQRAERAADDPEAPVPNSALPGSHEEAGDSAATDAGADALIDARPDARPDAAIDAPIDARPDAPIDARPDAAIDARPDATMDASSQPATDAATILAGAELGDGGAAPSDAGADAGEAVAATSLPPQMIDAGAPTSPIASTALPPSMTDAGAPTSPIASAASGSGAGSAATPGGGSASARTGSNAGSGPGSGPGSNAGSGAEALPNPGAAWIGEPAGPTASAGSGATAGPGSSAALGPADTAAFAAALAAGAVPGTTTEPAVDGAPTTAGTAANLLAYFPDGHVVTALIRFDRLRGTEWEAQTERLLRPMPDYQLLFGPRDAAITHKLDTLVISTPRPRDAAATTLVARTPLARGALRDFLGAASPVHWSATRGGLLGNRTGKLPPGDQRVFLSPFKGWFLLAQPGDLGSLAAARGDLNTIEATGKLPPWLTGIRAIEHETGEPRGPALVVTLGLGGKRFKLGGNDFGLGIRSVPTPDRVSLAMELVPQGWLVRGNLRFASDTDAAELIAAVQKLQQRVADSRTIQLVIGKPIAHVIANLAFARAGPRVSYATSISIADTRALLAFAAAQLDQYFGAAP
jgi:hypothetical protein